LAADPYPSIELGKWSAVFFVQALPSGCNGWQEWAGSMD